ncbi:ATP-binding protein, partial [Candidatus Woesearchaeota archaeon]|nr:ATP-binding protein [Candidatus Woesearchaeota archaeon]
PGTGKTTLCRTFAAESGLPCIEISIGDVADRFQDGPVERLKQGFESALEPIRSGNNEYSVLIIDEIEAITNVNATGDNNGSALRQIKLFDTYAGDGNQTPGLIIAATTNYLELLPGTVRDRFEVLDIPRPDNRTLKALLQYFTSERQSEAQIPIFDRLDLDRIAQACKFPDGKNFVARNVKMMVKGMMKEMRRNYRRGLEHIVDTDSFVRKARTFAHGRENNKRENSY